MPVDPPLVEHAAVAVLGEWVLIEDGVQLRDAGALVDRAVAVGLDAVGQRAPKMDDGGAEGGAGLRNVQPRHVRQRARLGGADRAWTQAAHEFGPSSVGM